jgi:hypothetical protein
MPLRWGITNLPLVPGALIFVEKISEIMKPLTNAGLEKSEPWLNYSQSSSRTYYRVFNTLNGSTCAIYFILIISIYTPMNGITR